MRADLGGEVAGGRMAWILLSLKKLTFCFQVDTIFSGKFLQENRKEGLVGSIFKNLLMPNQPGVAQL